MWPTSVCIKKALYLNTSNSITLMQERYTMYAVEVMYMYWIWFINTWNIAGALVSPNGMTLNLNKDCLFLTLTLISDLDHESQHSVGLWKGKSKQCMQLKLCTCIEIYKDCLLWTLTLMSDVDHECHINVFTQRMLCATMNKIHEGVSK